MILKFFREFWLWYLLYGILSFFYIIVFLLYHLPLDYFLTAFWLNCFFLIGISSYQFFKFRKRKKILDYLKELKDFKELTLPSDDFYYQAFMKYDKIREEQLLAEKEKLKHLRKTIKQWAHEMKIPLFGISLLTQTNRLEKREVEQQLLRLENDLDNLLTFIKFNEKYDDYRFTRFSCKEIVQEVVRKNRILFLAKHLSVYVEGDWMVKSDRKWLSFAVSQILDNAIKYSKPNGKIRIILTEGKLSIQDEGIGILAEDLPRLFEEGFTGFNGHEHQKATGLGLYMTKEILKSLELQILVSSELNKGTEVTILKR